MTLAQMREATRLGLDWMVIWAGADPVGVREHLCGGLPGSGDAYRSEWVRVRYAPTDTPGVQAAKCERCRTAWLRAVGG